MLDSLGEVIYTDYIENFDGKIMKYPGVNNIHVGMIYTFHWADKTQDYIFAQVGHKTFVLINLKSGNRYLEPKICNSNVIFSAAEIEEMFDCEDDCWWTFKYE